MPRNESERKKVTQLNERRQRKPPNNDESAIYPSSTTTYPSRRPPENVHAEHRNYNHSAPYIPTTTHSSWSQPGATQDSSTTQFDVGYHALSAPHAASFERDYQPQRTDTPWELSKVPSSNSGSMFNEASHFGIHNSQFTTHQWSPKTFYVNNYHLPGPSSWSSSRENNWYLPSPTTSLSGNFVGSSKGKAPSVPPIAKDFRSTLLTDLHRTSNTVYENHLSLKGRGHPMWIPDPSLSLPDTYREKGVCVGDVGIITAEGGFDFLFNICLPAGDPINAGDLPQNFSPIAPSLNKRDIREFREFQRGQYLGSSVRVKGSGTMFDSGLDFEPTSSEGAILTLPDGAFSQELNNVSLFRRYIANHAKSWYSFANGPRGREAKNGDLRVVVGFDKTTTQWGMAAFFDIASPSDLRLQFNAGHGPTTSISKVNSWVCTGVADYKTGPDDCEVLPARQDQQRGNQCLFVRTLNVTLVESDWNQIREQHNFALQYQPLKRCPMSVSSHQERNLINTPSFRKLSKKAEPIQIAPHQHEHPTVPTSHWDRNLINVPALRELSKTLGDHLSALFPLAKMIIINDRDWQSAIMLLQEQASHSDDKSLSFSDKQLFKERFLNAANQLNDSRYDEVLGMTYFEPKEITGTAISVLDGLASNIRNRRETFEGYLFDSIAPVSPLGREQFINALITKLSQETSSLDRTVPLSFLEGHKLHALSLEFDIIPRLNSLSTTSARCSIDTLRQETAELSAMHPEKVASTRCLAHALYARYLTNKQQDDLDEAIWWFKEAGELTPKEHYSYLDIVVSLCCSLYFRVQLLGLDEDRQSLLEALKIEREINYADVLQSAKDLVNHAPKGDLQDIDEHVAN